MSKLDEAWTVLKHLSKREQDVAAQAIFDFASGTTKLGLNSAQAAAVRSRLREKSPKLFSPTALRARLKKLER
jgi:hypothetical protein